MYDKIETSGRQAISNLNQAVQTRERGEILCTLDNMDTLLGELESNLDDLTKRIDAVLAPIAQSLFTHNERLAYFNRLLRELSGRVQL